MLASSSEPRTDAWMRAVLGASSLACSPLSSLSFFSFSIVARAGGCTRTKSRRDPLWRCFSSGCGGGGGMRVRRKGW